MSGEGNLWDQHINVLFICISFLKRSIHTLKHKVSCVNKAYTHEIYLLGGVLSVALKLSLPLNMSLHLERIALYVEHVKSTWHSSSTMLSLHSLHAFKFVSHGWNQYFLSLIGNMNCIHENCKKSLKLIGYPLDTPKWFFFINWKSPPNIKFNSTYCGIFGKLREILVVKI